MVAGASSRALTAEETDFIGRARGKAQTLYAGVVTPHRSCGIALAETFNLITRPYQALRRGGVTGLGYCGAIRAGELVLGELLGDPAPTGAVSPQLRDAMIWYQEQVPVRIDRRQSPDFICNHLTGQHGDFAGAARKEHCTSIAAEVAALTAEALVRFGDVCVDVTPVIAEEGA